MLAARIIVKTIEVRCPHGDCETRQLGPVSGAIQWNREDGWQLHCATEGPRWTDPWECEGCGRDLALDSGTLGSMAATYIKDGNA
jgi:hypothetical protein